jgi:hypothetical protein
VRFSGVRRRAWGNKQKEGDRVPPDRYLRASSNRFFPYINSGIGADISRAETAVKSAQQANVRPTRTVWDLLAAYILSEIIPSSQARQGRTPQKATDRTAEVPMPPF